MSQEGRQDKHKSVEGTDEKMDSEEKLVEGDPEKSEVEKDKHRDAEMTPEALQKIIAERTAEKKRKAEMKRLEILRRIAEMKSEDGIHPLDLFPKEIWLQILGDKDLSPRDRYNMRQVHPIFRDLTDDTVLLDILLPLAIDFEIPVLERVFHSLDRQAVKKQINILQNVSVNMKDAVDTWIEEDLLNSMRKSVTSPRLQDRWKLQVHCNGTIQQVNKPRFMPPTTPECFSKSLNVMLDVTFEGETEEGRRNNWDNCKDCINDLLGKVGNEILHLELRLNYWSLVDRAGALVDLIPFFGITVLEMCNAIKNWLNLVPNLKWLTLQIGNMEWEGVTFQDPPMPKLNALERVDLLDTGVSPFAEALLAANPHVKCITFEVENERSGTLARYAHPVVQRLPLEAINTASDWECRDLQFLQQISNSSWNLKKMTIWLKDVSMHILFQCLQENCPNLEHVSMCLFNVAVGKELNFLRLPNIKSLEVVFKEGMSFTGDFYFFFALHFLIHCGKLESLKWTNLVHEADLFKIGLQVLRGGESKRLIDFQGEGGVLQMDLSKSNIWEVFPQLKSITAKFRSYWYSIKERRGSVSIHRWD